MKDVYFDVGKKDLSFPEGEVLRAQNLFEVQVGTLYYIVDWGIDLEYFLNPDFQVQNESFEAYLTQRLGAFGFNVLKLKSITQSFTQNLIFTFGQTQDKTLIRG